MFTRMDECIWFLCAEFKSHRELTPNSPFSHSFPVFGEAPSVPPALLQCSWLFKLQVGASLAGGGAWTPVSLARDSLAVQEGRVKSTRRRKSAALGSPSSGSPTAHRGHRGAFTAVGQVERWGPRRGGGAAWTWLDSAGDPQSAHLPLSCGARVSARPPGAPTSARVSERTEERHSGG